MNQSSAANKGFTLIELLTVILIISILMGVAIPQYTRSVRRAEMAEGLIQGKTIYDAAVRHKGAYGSSPTSFDGLDVAFVDAEVTGSEFDDGTFKYQLKPGYVAAVNQKGDYEIRFIYPTSDDNGVYAPVACCPSTSFICQNAGETSTATGMPTDKTCTEIK
ncbi:MAG: type II secretion system protein [Elusimicrobiaceae bacterium]|nr:type II secretion system protein [Elusimicrobiaceae bacterium]